MSSCLLFLHTKTPSKKGSSLTRKILLPEDANSFVSEEIAFQRRGRRDYFVK